jgi:hypothetical protein
MSLGHTRRLDLSLAWWMCRPTRFGLSRRRVRFNWFFLKWSPIALIRPAVLRRLCPIITLLLRMYGSPSCHHWRQCRLLIDQHGSSLAPTRGPIHDTPSARIRPDPTSLQSAEPAAQLGHGAWSTTPNTRRWILDVEGVVQTDLGGLHPFTPRNGIMARRRVLDRRRVLHYIRLATYRQARVRRAIRQRSHRPRGDHCCRSAIGPGASVASEEVWNAAVLFGQVYLASTDPPRSRLHPRLHPASPSLSLRRSRYTCTFATKSRLPLRPGICAGLVPGWNREMGLG